MEITYESSNRGELAHDGGSRLHANRVPNEGVSADHWLGAYPDEGRLGRTPDSSATSNRPRGRRPDSVRPYGFKRTRCEMRCISEELLKEQCAASGGIYKHNLSQFLLFGRSGPP
ncbi:hypothetical protein EYF80_052638 [Liparis tanakae]|uniref:Uncharacterized protein n=1 Tax=Liparis tanakae TaxID=230148 RepID=A0A4Z2F8Q6_9TELE|nr:hypothetical protein EYF80_052638 [Liparis tanakae]